jgi:charged multivesicular body protein 1
LIFSVFNSSQKKGNLFNLKFAAKELERNAKKCEKDAVADKEKLKRAITQGNMEGAQIYAENSIRNKNQA